MFDPDDYELHEAQKHARKMARERDEARVMVEKLTAELAACAEVLPGAYYMDPPDGGDVPVSEQLLRMAKDAARYRYLERKVAIAGAQFHILNLPRPVHVVAPSAAAEFRAVLDAELSVSGATRPPTPTGWSDTDWTKHLQERQHPLQRLCARLAELLDEDQWHECEALLLSAGVVPTRHPLDSLHINQGSMDAAADAYEAEYNAAQEARRAEFDAEMRLDAFGPKHG
jgi:hypothetical protein